LIILTTFTWILDTYQPMQSSALTELSRIGTVVEAQLSLAILSGHYKARLIYSNIKESFMLPLYLHLHTMLVCS